MIVPAFEAFPGHLSEGTEEDHEDPRVEQLILRFENGLSKQKIGLLPTKQKRLIPVL